MDGFPIDRKLDKLLGALRRRKPVIDAAEFERLLGELTDTGGNDASRRVRSQWLRGLWQLSRYRETEALSTLEGAADALAPLLQADPDSAALNELSAAICEGQLEAAYLTSDYSRANELAGELWTERMSTADRRAKAVAATWLGVLHQQTGRYQEALRMLGRAVADFELAGVPAQASRAMNALACLHEEMGDFERAFTLYAEALQRARQDENADMVGRVLANWGDAHVERGTHEEGLSLLQQAIAELQAIDAHWHYAWCQLAVGKVYAARGDFAEAAAYHQLALASVRKSDAPRIECEILAGMGALAGQMGDYEAACAHLGTALQLAERLGIDREVMRTHQGLSAVHKKFGNFELALMHFEAFHDSRARVFDAVARVRVAQLESEAEVELARRDRELSQLRNVELASALEEVRQLNLELSEKARVLEELSNHDPLTGLHNRRYLYNRIAGEIQRFQRYGDRFSVAIYDVDNFKQVNDVYSHAIGDEVLVTLAQLVESVLRESDVHARYGGEEFAVILPAAGMAEALRVMEKLREVVEGFEWQVLAEGLAVTISAGVAEILPDEAATPLLNRADGMLYEAKRGGRNRVHG